MVWPGWATQLFIELLSLRVPPSAIPATIMATTSAFQPNGELVKNTPCVKLMRESRGVMCVVTKTLAAYQLASSPVWKEQHSDATNRRQTNIENCIVRAAREGGFKCITLSSCILPEDGKATTCVTAIDQAYREGREHLEDWRKVTEQMYPDRQEIINLIPPSSDLTLTKLADHGVVMTDTCDTARKFRREFKEHVTKVCLEAGMSTDQICIYEGDCWHHLRNVWIDNVVSQLSERLSDILENDLEEISPVLRVTTEIDSLLIAIEKYFGGNANYAKGKGAEFEHYMNTYHPGAYLYPVARACGGSRQDISTEGAVPVLMNLPYYLEFLNWRLSMKADGILERNLQTLLESVEVVGMLRVLSTIHTSIVMPMRWLSGNAQDLAEYDFGLADMARCADYMEEAFIELHRMPKNIQ